jgi:hypothetical protein
MTNLKDESKKAKKKTTIDKDEMGDLKEEIKDSKLRTKVMKKMIDKLNKDQDKADEATDNLIGLHEKE